MPAESEGREEGRFAGAALRVGVWASVAIMAAALVLSVLRPGRGETLAWLGVAVLVATPLLRVVFLAAAFARGRQWRLLAASVAVLGLLAAGIVLGRPR